MFTVAMMMIKRIMTITMSKDNNNDNNSNNTGYLERNFVCLQ